MTIEELQRIVTEVIGYRELDLTRDMAARDVPGWDSLAHTLIVLEIAETAGIEIDAVETSELPDLGALLDLVAAREGR